MSARVVKILPLAVFLVLVLGLTAPPAVAQEAGASDAVSAADAKRLEKERAKQARISEYLRKREERRARRELEREGGAPENAAPSATSGAGARATNDKKARKARTRRRSDVLPRNLARIHDDLHKRELGQDPTVMAYLTLIESGEASAHQLAAFGNFLAQLGLSREAIEYYGVALDMERDDPVLWINVGTLHRQRGEYSEAASAYVTALNIDENNAFAHYNLGAVLDEMGDYEGSIEEYKLALILDPTLGDPAFNPQATNNERLLAVKLLLYKEQSGSLGLPLVDVPGGEVDAERPPR